MNDNPELSPLIRHARQRSAAIRERLCKARVAIEKDIDAAGGVYPMNGGRLSIAEVCRRARVSRAVLEGPLHKKTTLKDTKVWLSATLGKMIHGSRSVRRLITDRVDNWRDRCHRYADQTHLYHLQMITLQNQLRDSQSRIADLESELSAIRAIASNGRVVPMRAASE